MDEQPPHLFMSSFNEFIGGRQKPAVGANTARNMGLPYDPQSQMVWVDTYGSEFRFCYHSVRPSVHPPMRTRALLTMPELYQMVDTHTHAHAACAWLRRMCLCSRDLEPNVEAGDRIWQVASSCVQMYKAGQKCPQSPALAAAVPCCSTADKQVFANVWSLVKPQGQGQGGGGGGAFSDAILTSNATEKTSLIAQGYVEVCNPVPGPTVFCVDTSIQDGRNGCVGAQGAWGGGQQGVRRRVPLEQTILILPLPLRIA